MSLGGRDVGFKWVGGLVGGGGEHGAIVIIQTLLGCSFAYGGFLGACSAVLGGPGSCSQTLAALMTQVPGQLHLVGAYKWFLTGFSKYCPRVTMKPKVLMILVLGSVRLLVSLDFKDSFKLSKPYSAKHVSYSQSNEYQGQINSGHRILHGGCVYLRAPGT